MAGRRKRLTLSTLVKATAALCIISTAAGSYLRNAVWDNPVSLWTDVVSKSPGKGRDHYNLGFALAMIEDYSDAEQELKKAIELEPTYLSHSNLASVYYLQDRIEEAEVHYLLALRYNPSHPQLHYNLGILYQETGRFSEAWVEFKRTSELDPGYEEAYDALEKIRKLVPP